ncbi:MAG: EpsI family protein [Rhodoferax sp.]|nr:EpsI family protein [Rhodoferax sp.]
MSFPRRHVLLAALMIGSASAAMVLKPTPVKIDPSQRVDYETIIPMAFGTWTALPSNLGAVVNPQAQEVLDRLYSQIVSRVYLDSVTGKTIMLSLAYGEEQNKQSQVHLPEVCYPAQGFQMRRASDEQLKTDLGVLPIKRLEASLGSRNEPITYWIRIGDHLVRGGYEQKITTIREGFAGRVADGILFRVSSIDQDARQAYALQDRFVTQLLSAVDPKVRHLLIGALAGTS